MRKALRLLDRILRGQATAPPMLIRQDFELPLTGLSILLGVLAALYGICMALPALISRWQTPTRFMGYEQLLASMVKVPMLFFLTLLVTFPSLYVFNAILGSRLLSGAMLRLLVSAGAVMLAVLSSFGPIVAFFAVSTTSYPFMKLMNVVVFTLAGFMGLAFLLRTLQRLSLAWEIHDVTPSVGSEGPVVVPEATPSAPAASRSIGAIDRIGGSPPGHVNTVFRIWLIVFGLVGAQMGWVLRPFIGDPVKDFTFFRPRTSNFFEQIIHTVENLVETEASTPSRTNSSREP